MVTQKFCNFVVIEGNQMPLGILCTPCPEKKSLRYFMCNFTKFKDIFLIFGVNHPETTFLLKY